MKFNVVISGFKKPVSITKTYIIDTGNADMAIENARNRMINFMTDEYGAYTHTIVRSVKTV